MMQEIRYSKWELKSRKCSNCNQDSDEILINDGRCIDCIHEEIIFKQTMKNWQLSDDDREIFQ